MLDFENVLKLKHAFLSYKPTHFILLNNEN